MVPNPDICHLVPERIYLTSESGHRERGGRAQGTHGVGNVSSGWPWLGRFCLGCLLQRWGQLAEPKSASELGTDIVQGLVTTAFVNSDSRLNRLESINVHQTEPCSPTYGFLNPPAGLDHQLATLLHRQSSAPYGRDEDSGWRPPKYRALDLSVVPSGLWGKREVSMARKLEYWLVLGLALALSEDRLQRQSELVYGGWPRIGLIGKWTWIVGAIRTPLLSWIHFGLGTTNTGNTFVPGTVLPGVWSSKRSIICSTLY
ncbi:hypothetical protein PM082_023135 [Marasmius tenuissimus]|nr:hypothetical protein PM082_023135 [Marasmius tenuissimus]